MFFYREVFHFKYNTRKCHVRQFGVHILQRGWRKSSHLLSETRTEAPRRAPARTPRSISGSRTTPFAFSAWLYSSVGSASSPLLQLRPRPCLPSHLPACGSWRSSSAERSGTSAGGGGPKVVGGEASAQRRRDEPCGRFCSRTEAMTDPENIYENNQSDVRTSAEYVQNKTRLTGISSADLLVFKLNIW